MLLDRYPWLTYVLPFAVFMLVGTLEPRPPAAEPSTSWLALSYDYYPVVYTLKIVMTVLAIGFVLPGYRQFPLRVSLGSIVVGVVGVVIWVGLCHLELERQFLPRLGLGWLVDTGTRSAFNPFQELREYPAAWAWTFLAIRFLGLVAVVPILEEFFLRGFLMRCVMDPEWEKVPFGHASATAVVVGTVFPMLMHPGELLAAAVWFSLITWLMVRTRSIWDCVVAHAVTNLLLGVYVLTSGEWRLL